MLTKSILYFQVVRCGFNTECVVVFEDCFAGVCFPLDRPRAQCVPSATNCFSDVIIVTSLFGTRVFLHSRNDWPLCHRPLQPKIDLWRSDWQMRSISARLAAIKTFIMLCFCTHKLRVSFDACVTFFNLSSTILLFWKKRRAKKVEAVLSMAVSTFELHQLVLRLQYSSQVYIVYYWHYANGERNKSCIQHGSFLCNEVIFSLL